MSEEEAFAYEIGYTGGGHGVGRLQGRPEGVRGEAHAELPAEVGREPRPPHARCSSARAWRTSTSTIPDAALEAIDAHGAGVRARRAGVVARARGQSILVPRGTWRYRDPGRLLATRFGADARTVVGEFGILQQTLVTRRVHRDRARRSRRRARRRRRGQVPRSARARSRGRVRRRPSKRTSLRTSARPRRRDHPADRDRRRPHHPGGAVRDHRDRVARRARPDGGDARGGARRAVGGVQRDRRRQPRRVAPRRDRARVPVVAVGQEPDVRGAVHEMALLAMERRPGRRRSWCARPKQRSAPACRATTGCSRSRAVESNAMVPLSQRGELHRSPAVSAGGEQLAEMSGVDPPRRRSRRPLQLLPVGGAGAGRRAGPRARPTAHRHRRHDVRGRPARQLQLPGARQDGRSAARAAGHNRARHLHQRDDHQARDGDVVDDSAGRRVPLRRRVRRDERGVPRCATSRPTTTGPRASTGTRWCTHAPASPSAPSSSPPPPDGRRAVAASTDTDLAAAMVDEEWCGRDVHVTGSTFH